MIKKSAQDIVDIIDQCAKKGYNIKVRDISYLYLCEIYVDDTIAYKSIFGDDDDSVIYEYKHSNKIKYLKSILDTNMVDTKMTQKDISFEENKAYMLSLKKQTEEAIEKEEIDKKDGLKILADLSVKLNDKFNVADNTKNQVVIVNQKYNDVCPYCNREISAKVLTKEEAIKMYNLVEK